MKRLQIILVAACLILVIGATARAQMGMNFFRKPALTDFFNPVVGSGAAYETLDSDRSSAKSPMEIVIVGKEMVGLKEAYWLEFSLNAKEMNGTMYSKILISKGDFKRHRTIFQFPGAPAMEMPASTASREDEKIGGDLAKWSQVGTETITVPAGTFLCQHWKKKDGKEDAWVSDKVTPFGLVKETGSGSSDVLVKVITGAKDHITGPVTPFDPRVFQQIMMNQAGRGRQ
ncbi:MAG: hypothetical protein WCE61_01085 [Candidatus Acidiferrum sp.]